MQVSAFYNIGSLTSHAKTINGNVITPGIESDTFILQSAGLGFSAIWPEVTLQGVLGRRIDNEVPERLLDDDDDFHGWLQVVYNF
jgi:hypothetical protein